MIHNRSTYSNHGCRCEICREAAHDYYLLKKAGLWKPAPETPDLLCLVHGEAVCPCIDSAPGPDDLGKPFEVAVWQCMNGHQDLGTRRIKQHYTISCLRCDGLMFMVHRGVIVPV